MNQEKRKSEQNDAKDEFDELEIITKKMIPDYNFDTFGNKDFKKSVMNSNEKSDLINNTKTTEYDFDSDENDPLHIDNECKFFSSEINQSNRNYVERSKEQQEQRRKLPIYLKESEIIDSINNNFVTIICGETGSGN